jgi:hypothetical protein
MQVAEAYLVDNVPNTQAQTPHPRREQSLQRASILTVISDVSFLKTAQKLETEWFAVRRMASVQAMMA